MYSVLSQRFLNWYAATAELVSDLDFDEGEFPHDIVNVVNKAFDVVDDYELRPLLPGLSKQGRELLKQIEADYGE
ncbi:hypothetical protein ACXM2N_03305 [Corynebacterium sp. ZY180755]